jgi:hypothetical protein
MARRPGEGLPWAAADGMLLSMSLVSRRFTGPRTHLGFGVAA